MATSVVREEFRGFPVAQKKKKKKKHIENQALCPLCASFSIYIS
jgi:hypothetical protein